MRKSRMHIFRCPPDIRRTTTRTTRDACHLYRHIITLQTRPHSPCQDRIRTTKMIIGRTRSHAPVLRNPRRHLHPPSPMHLRLPRLTTPHSPHHLTRLVYDPSTFTMVCNCQPCTIFLWRISLPQHWRRWNRRPMDCSRTYPLNTADSGFLKLWRLAMVPSANCLSPWSLRKTKPIRSGTSRTSRTPAAASTAGTRVPDKVKLVTILLNDSEQQ